MKGGRYDCIVVGAGPAGSTAARRLAQRGWEVLLLERDALDRRKACAGGISPRALRGLDFSIDSVLEHTVGMYQFSYKARSFLKGKPIDLAIHMVRRCRFDALLAQKAAEAGARVLAHSPVEEVHEEAKDVWVRCGEKRYRGAALIGADGGRGIVAKTLGLTKGLRRGLAIEAEVQVPPEALGLAQKAIHFDLGALPRGYRWIFPKGDHLNIGAITTLDRVGGLKASLMDYLQNHPLLRENSNLSITGASVPLRSSHAPLNTSRAIVCGDATGLIDPLTGEGIQYAIETGNLGAEVVDGFLKRGESLEAYSRHIGQTVITELTFADRFARLLLDHPYICYLTGVRSQRVMNLLADMASGRKTYSQIYRETRKRFAWRFQRLIFEGIGI